jgi:hypothetical protein
MCSIGDGMWNAIKKWSGVVWFQEFDKSGEIFCVDPEKSRARVSCFQFWVYNFAAQSDLMGTAVKGTN